MYRTSGRGKGNGREGRGRVLGRIYCIGRGRERENREGGRERKIEKGEGKGRIEKAEGKGRIEQGKRKGE